MQGSSIRNFLHLLQHRTSLIHYDHGHPAVNQLHYGQSIPPYYNYSRIRSNNIYVFYSENDWYLHPDNVRRLRDGLQGK